MTVMLALSALALASGPLSIGGQQLYCDDDDPSRIRIRPEGRVPGFGLSILLAPDRQAADPTPQSALVQAWLVTTGFAVGGDPLDGPLVDTLWPLIREPGRRDIVAELPVAWREVEDSPKCRESLWRAFADHSWALALDVLSLLEPGHRAVARAQASGSCAHLAVFSLATEEPGTTRVRAWQDYQALWGSGRPDPARVVDFGFARWPVTASVGWAQASVAQDCASPASGAR